MTSRRMRAVELLMAMQPEQVAEALGIRENTLRQWMEMPDFREALRQREAEQRRTLARIGRQAAVNAAQALCTVAGDRAKVDAKVLLEVIKASGGFEAEAEDAGESLAAIIRAARSEAEASGE